MLSRPRRFEPFFRRDGTVLVAVGLLATYAFVAGPLVEAHALPPAVVVIVYAMFLAAAAAYVFEARARMVYFSLLIAATATLAIAAHAAATPAVDTASTLASMVAAVLLARLFLMRGLGDARTSRHRNVAIFAALVLIGVAFTHAFRLVALHVPDAFVLAGAPVANDALLPRLEGFSFVTLAALGFGDIVPLHPIARAVAALEALTGALFAIVVIGKRVTMEIDRRERRERIVTARAAEADPTTAHRARIAAMYLHGSGLEIGALDLPTPVAPGTVVRYVDFRTPAELARHYPELDASRLVPLDLLDDGERLDAVPDASVDFIIANQMLEHCENPLGTIRRHLCKVKIGGCLYYALPDRRVSFDKARPLTPFEHLAGDDADGGANSRFAHYLEWARLVNEIADDEAAQANARANLVARYSIHFHVWDSSSWLEFLTKARDYLGGAFECRHFEFTGTEILCVLRRE